MTWIDWRSLTDFGERRGLVEYYFIIPLNMKQLLKN